MPRDNVVVGVDIGTTKVVAVVAEVTTQGRLNIIGLGETPSGGLRKGIIVDIENTARAIEKAVEQAERMSGCQVTTAFVGLTGPHIGSVNNRGVVAVTGEDGEVGPEDVERVLQAARVIPLPSDRRIIHVLPRQYIVDGYDGIMDPIGMSGSRLEVETQIVTAAAAAIQNTLKSVQRAGLQVEELVLNPLASAEAVLQPAEKELGTVVVDIGGGTTEIAVFSEGSLWYASVLPIGSEHITSDLAVGLRTPLSQAEVIKKEHGCVSMEGINENETVEVQVVGGKEKKRVPRKMLAAIIEPRVEEIFTLVRREIENANFQGLLPGGVVLTGGGALLEGIARLAGAVLAMPVRLGWPENSGGLGDMVASPAYATAVGLVTYGSIRLAHSQAAATREAFWENFWSRLKNWWRELF
ncbi:cell division protein FtsA [Neomoorella humiferrea]|uniref:Cell division protein FtsA n=1 Tax=Neomoorella humiferrea TaxID=676965 RepID=A0A2T0AMU2_9FIRM|nr:cell division protein FtsA [Moorella humiferrea]PRR70188.1 Cell division protein FtsA [Moorella humiferrea]